MLSFLHLVEAYANTSFDLSFFLDLIGRNQNHRNQRKNLGEDPEVQVMIQRSVPPQEDPEVRVMTRTAGNEGLLEVPVTNALLNRGK